MTSSCSFRITRTAEDMAHTINVLSQRVIQLEQRQASLEFKLSQKNIDLPLEETKILDDEELASAKHAMSEDQYNQEYECSWSAAIPGAIYAKELEKIESWDDLTWEQRKEKGFVSVDNWFHNHDSKKDFIQDLADSIEDLAIKS